MVDASLTQEGHERARASAAFLTAADQPPGEVWSPETDLPVPPQGCTSPQGSPPLIKSGDSGWTSDFAANQNSERKATWQSLPPLVAGESITTFQRAAIMGDVTNLVCHWGSEGAGYINTDVTVTLSE